MEVKPTRRGHARKVAGGERPRLSQAHKRHTGTCDTCRAPCLSFSRAPTVTRITDGARARVARGDAPALFAIVGHARWIAGGEGSVGCPAKSRRRSSVPAAQGDRLATPSFYSVCFSTRACAVHSRAASG